MKVTYCSQDGRLTIEAEGDQQKDIFKQISSFQEVFENSYCGKCKNNDIKFVVRIVDDNDFYELHCMSCRAKLAFGQHKGKDGTLFPRRKDGDGNWLPNGGWVKYNSETKKEE